MSEANNNRRCNRRTESTSGKATLQGLNIVHNFKDGFKKTGGTSVLMEHYSGNQFEGRFFNRDSRCYFSVDAFSENGIIQGKEMVGKL